MRKIVLALVLVFFSCKSEQSDDRQVLPPFFSFDETASIDVELLEQRNNPQSDGFPWCDITLRVNAESDWESYAFDFIARNSRLQEVSRQFFIVRRLRAGVPQTVTGELPVRCEEMPEFAIRMRDTHTIPAD